MRGGFLSKLLCGGAVVLGLGQAAAASDVTTPIEQLDAGLLEVMKAGKAAPFQQRYDLLAPLVIHAIDLDAILEGAVGSAWATLPPDKKNALKAAFQHYSVATYVAHFDEFNGQRFDLTPPASGGDPVVRVKIVPGKPEDETHTLGYAMRQTSAGWMAIDVTADSSISQVVAQQEEIRAVLRSGGTSGLYARLQEKTAELSGGAVH
jgi:phospholipid transport system substrate-binding protein